MLVCEGYVDVIAMHQAGFTNAVASLGTAFTSQHAMLLKRYTDQVILTLRQRRSRRESGAPGDPDPERSRDVHQGFKHEAV